MELRTGTFWLTRIVLLRYVAFIYLIAFLVAYNQNEALIGKNGLLPAHVHLNRISKASNGGYWSKLHMAPTVLWFFNYNNNIDEILNSISFTGLLLSSFVIIKGSSNFVIMLSLWFLYHSVVNVGQRWYSFGWESQLLETGFLAVFLCPFFSLKKFPKTVPCSFLIIMLYRWLIFRIMLGAGLIKLRGDRCWWDLTCMNYHYETQPVPNPISYYMHQEPVFFHKFETMVNHFVELIAPICLLMPRKFCIFGGLVQIVFQIVLIISGNLSFLNWLTIAPCLACFDDLSLSYFFSKTEVINVKLIQRQNELEKQTPLILANFARKCTNWLFVCVIAYLSIPIVQNLWSPNQIMNTSFEPLRIVNTYGAFGSINKKRTEVIFQGTYSADPMNSDANWLEYEFKCKPGNEKRWPCVISPYHYRLDWLMWFAAFQNYQHNPWLLHLGLKFLSNDNKTTSLVSHNPFSGKQPPKWIRAEHYQYSFTKIGSNSAKEGKWWKRRHIGSYLPPISLETAKHLVDRFYLID
ncbi:hypothetical protein HELRODRAFT_73251 [Helobdella robusta]|uniref:Lipase maturation factor n=1 Tax=Helobdella robusta TaxID=6412 RepID=T1G1C1_HELRO|nr:hypothetical protein HELRODRAFT_73251 [Helobdella robusta]ESO09975.1 hypothetical protein HELRODRAFT_73251 [Helobdella robusta]